MKLSLIVAVSQNGVIGSCGKIPWHLSEDLKHFKELTWGHPIIMGRKTFDSLGKPLPGRTHIILTQNPKPATPDITWVSSLDAALAQASQSQEAFVIGGAQIYHKALPWVDTLYLTRIEQDFEGDTFFKTDFSADGFLLTKDSGVLYGKKEGLPYRFQTWARTAQQS